MQLSGPTWYVSSASVVWLSLLAVDRVSPSPACGCQEEDMLADVNSPSSLVAEAEMKLFRPADSISCFKLKATVVIGSKPRVQFLNIRQL